jgi:uncharacterized damage-inducible protein DinB
MGVQDPDALKRTQGTREKPAAKTPLSLYDRDFALWTNDQADALRQHRAVALDWENLAEEIEALARRDKRAIRSSLENALLHLLKVAHSGTERPLIR